MSGLLVSSGQVAGVSRSKPVPQAVSRRKPGPRRPSGDNRAAIIRMRSILSSKFGEWTRRPGEAVVNIFEGIRDIPYAVVPSLYGLEEGPAGMLNENRGFCVPKHYLFGVMCGRLGIKVKYCVYPFRWSDAVLPERLKEQAGGLPVTMHLACKAMIGGKWALVDATWDAPLKKAGLPVNLRWDGLSDTLNAVKPLAEHVCASAEDAEALLEEKNALYSISEKVSLARFSGDLNKWLEEVRSS